MTLTTNILGSQYSLIFSDAETYPELKTADGFINLYKKVIVIENNDISKKEDLDKMRQTIAHEVIHAYLHESGLAENSHPVNSWASNEEMVDWFSLQLSKINRTLNEIEERILF